MKSLIKKVKVTNDEIHRGNNFELEYYLVKTADNIYGIEIHKIANTLETEVRCIKDIFCNKEQSMELLKKLAKNKVTPVTFEDVVYDYLGTI